MHHAHQHGLKEPSSSSVGPVRTRTPTQEKIPTLICINPGCRTPAQHNKWCQGYCTHHAHEHGLKEPSASSVGPVRHHLCSYENCSSQPARLRWTGTYCRYHATMEGLREEHMCKQCLDGESWIHEAAWANKLCLHHAFAAGLRPDDSDLTVCRIDSCKTPPQAGLEGYCKLHFRQHRISKKLCSFMCTLDQFRNDTVATSDVGFMECYCKQCGSCNFAGEQIGSGKHAHFNICCRNGKVDIPTVPNPPQVLQDLLVDNTAAAKHFRSNVRAYNAALSFVSFGSDFDAADVLPGNGPPIFKIHGSIYHMSGRLHAQDPDRASYAQIYLYNHSEATRIRSARNPQLRPDVLTSLHDMIADSATGNAFYQAFRLMNELTQLWDRNEIPDVSLGFRASTSSDKRRYNHPTVNEVAAIFRAEDGAPPDNRDIVVWPREENCFRISENNENVDPLTYTLLFPFGTQGWHSHMTHKRKTAKNNRLTATEFYAHRLMIFNDSNNSHILPHSAGLLFQQYVVDAYCRAEAQRLFYLRSHQEDLRAELYDEIVEAAQSKDFVPGVSDVGKRIVLPSSYPGSPRALQQAYLDCMTMVGHFGRPDLFITFTANPKWPEILHHLRNAEEAANRPDLVARVFKLKLDELLHDLLDGHVLGRVVAWSYVIEFQKRGLPHAHILLILAKEDKPLTPAKVDQLVVAELPDLEDPNQAGLANIVIDRMLHGPCGTRNPSAPCMEDGKCCKGYYPPKAFRNETSIVNASYPLYRRRDDGRVACKNGFEFDNRDVVPYNPFLCKKYNAHINVEIVASIKAVKYLFKYTFKGHDRAEVDAQIDEITEHINARYVGPAEACWRLFEFPLHRKSHTVVRLALHLPGKQITVFEKGQELARIASAAAQRTSLTAWFELNKKDSNARKYLYSEIPQHYKWNHKDKKWVKRVQFSSHKILGRIYSASPQEGERFYLYLLLLHVRGANDWTDLSKDGSFRAKAEEKGLVDTDDEYIRAFADAATHSFPSQLRRFFVHLIVLCELKAPHRLWEQYADELAADFRATTDSSEIAHGQALQALADDLLRLGSSLQAQGLPEPPSIPKMTLRDREIKSAYNYDKAEESNRAQQMFDQMRPDQKEVFQSVTDAIVNNKAAMFFVDGPGGSGKTFLEQSLLSFVRGRGAVATSCAWSGIAATLLPGGRTCHVTFGLPVPLGEHNAVSSLSFQSGRAEVLRQALLIVWDEAPMSPKSALDAVDKLLQDLMHTTEPFGGKVILFAGDFRQVLPVIERGSKEYVLQQSLRFHPYFTQSLVDVYSLTGNHRAKEDIAYATFLLDLGDGSLPVLDNDLQPRIALPDACVANVDVSTATIVQKSFPDLKNTVSRCATESLECTAVQKLRDTAILSPTNAAVQTVNDEVLYQLEVEGIAMTTYFSRDRIQGDTTIEMETSYPLDFLHTLTPSGLPPHEMRLFPGALVMLLRNLDTEAGICNGVRAIVKRCQPRMLDVLIITGRAAGERVFIPKIDLTSQSTDLPFSLVRRQFPIRLSYAMTINKAQGQSLQFVTVYLHQPVFTHGQLYVALSRVGSFRKLRIFIDTVEESQGVHFDSEKPFCITTLNIVWKEALLSHASLSSTGAMVQQSFPRPPETSTFLDSSVVQKSFPRPAESSSFLDSSVVQQSFPRPTDTSSFLDSSDLTTPPIADRVGICLQDTFEPSDAALYSSDTEDQQYVVAPWTTDTDSSKVRSQTPLDLIHETLPFSDNDSSTSVDSLEVCVPNTSQHNTNFRLQYDGFFERQEEMRCGKHALNNALGGEHIFSNQDMSTACEIFIWESKFPDAPGYAPAMEIRSRHEKPNGWYSFQVMGTALRHTAVFALSEQPLRESPDIIYNQAVVGAVVNLNNQHWVAIKFRDGALWLLDSGNQGAVYYSYPMYLAYVQEHRHSYPIYRI